VLTPPRCAALVRSSPRYGRGDLVGELLYDAGGFDLVEEVDADSSNANSRRNMSCTMTISRPSKCGWPIGLAGLAAELSGFLSGVSLAVMTSNVGSCETGIALRGGGY
jgi:hypothetical protein